ncbi:MAG TPA: 4Fe-4S binding protein [Chloroflexi bacterium]|nr:4Fe-4S binding protein [Chloroflexota bacterium]
MKQIESIRQESAPARRFWTWLVQRRPIVQIISALTLNSYFTQRITRGLPCPALNCYACPAASFACPIGSIQHFVGRRKVPLYVLGVVGLVGALIGRASCGWFCPFGWFQELVYRLPVPKLRLPNRFNWSRYVILVALVFVVPFLTADPWFCKLCPAGTLEAGIPVVLLSADVRALIGPFYWLKIALLAATVGWMGVTRRPFCRWLCPLGALWAPFNPISAFRLRVDRETCTCCNRCQAVCPVDIRVHEDPTSGACIRCLACIRVCPTGCISVESPRWTMEAIGA